MASKIVGIAMQNFTAAPEMPDPQGLIDYAVRMEELGYESVWVWDHILLGVEPYFPILDSLTVLTAVAARTSQIRIGTGILVLPSRNPVVLAKQLSSLDQISNGGSPSAWRRAGTSASSTPWACRSTSAATSWTRIWRS